MTNIVLPNETNSLRNLFGGELLAKMDRCASISAARHCERRVVTASVNHVSFNHPIPEGGVVVLESKVSRPDLNRFREINFVKHFHETFDSSNYSIGFSPFSNDKNNNIK